MPRFIQNKARVHFNLFKSEYETIQAYARQNHISTSQVIRMLIRTLIIKQLEEEENEKQELVIVSPYEEKLTKREETKNYLENHLENINF